MKLPHGKIPIDLLREVVFKNLGAKRNELILGPSAGIDGAVIKTGNQFLIVSMDPITGATERIGWLVVNVNANDVATFGVEPAFFFSCLLLPEDSDRKSIETICLQMNKASKKLGMAISGGHCEVTPGLANPIIVGCAMGIAKEGDYVTANGSKAEDKLILTKWAGIEGTAILASDRGERLKESVKPEALRIARGFYNWISVVKEAIAAFKTGGVDAMHDPTEGGIIGGVYEMAEASNLGVRIFEEEIPIHPVTADICRFFKVDPLRLIGSGALLIAAKPQAANKIIKDLRSRDIPAALIGSFLRNPDERVIVEKNETEHALSHPAPDQLWLALQQK